MTSEAKWRSLVAQGWTTMLLIFLGNMLMDVVRASVERKLLNWADHMGPQGLQVVLVVIAIYAAMPPLVRAVPARRPIIVVAVMLTFFIGLFVAAHEVSHVVVNKDKPFGVLHVLDLLHHAVAIGTMAAGVMWFRALGQGAGAAGSEEARPGAVVLPGPQAAIRS